MKNSSRQYQIAYLREYLKRAVNAETVQRDIERFNQMTDEEYEIETRKLAEFYRGDNS